MLLLPASGMEMVSWAWSSSSWWRISAWSVSTLSSEDVGAGAAPGALPFSAEIKCVLSRSVPPAMNASAGRAARGLHKERKSVVEGRSGAVRVDLGGRGFLKKKNNTNHN